MFFSSNLMLHHVDKRFRKNIKFYTYCFINFKSELRSEYGLMRWAGMYRKSSAMLSVYLKGLTLLP